MVRSANRENRDAVVGVSGGRGSPGKQSLQARRWAYRIAQNDAAAMENFPEFRGGSRALACADRLRRVHIPGHGDHRSEVMAIAIPK